MVKGKNQVHSSSERGGVGEGAGPDFSETQIKTEMDKAGLLSSLLFPIFQTQVVSQVFTECQSTGMFLHKCILSTGPIRAISILTTSSI